MWSKKLRFSKLGTGLFFRVIGAAAVSLFIFWALTFLEMYALAHIYTSTKLFQHKAEETAEEFQEYISDNRIELGDTDAIREWDIKNSLLSIKVIENNRVIYDTQEYMLKYAPRTAAAIYDLENTTGFEIQFEDGTAMLYPGMMYKNKLEKKIDFVITCVSILLFCFIILKGFSRMVKDVMKIEKGIRILESGDLTYRIEIKRKDELNELADSINRMSRELSKQGQEEELLRQENYDLVTAVSHDVRTPLTSVISYTDLCMDPKKTLEEKEKYLLKIKDRAYLIKDLTDNLFFHFINKSRKYELHPELITGNDFIVFLMNNMKEELEDRGYRFQAVYSLEEEFFMKVDVVQIRRVFNNLEGNLVKYAKKNEEIEYSAHLREDMLCITGKNRVHDPAGEESHGVGMVSSMEIIKLHSGEMESFLDGSLFVVRIRLPILLMKQIEREGGSPDEKKEKSV